LFIILPLDHIPGVVAMIGMPLRFHPYDHGRLALNETPYPAFDNFFYFFFIARFSFFFVVLHIRVVLHSLRAGNGGRSLMIPTARYKLFARIPQ
jgi:hypothetical protein